MKKKIILQPVRGMRDFLPNDMIKRNFIFDIIKETYENYGFLPFETPAIEYLDVLTAKSGPEIVRQIYSFEDKGGRKVGLRFELTISLARVVASNPTLPKPFKRYCISRVWRYEEPQAGRYREFWQADADIIGVNSRIADVEVIAAARTALIRLGFKNFEIRVNSRKLLDALAVISGIEEEEAKLNFFRAIDKIEKIGENGVREELYRMGISSGNINKILDFIKIRGPLPSMLPKIEDVLDYDIKSANEGIADLKQMNEFGKSYGIANEMIFDMSLARGLDYYTGPVFEIISKDMRIGSIAGGGRYDTLIQILGGAPTPAVGIALGVERIFEIMKKTNMFPKEITNIVQVYIATSDKSLIMKAIEIAEILRNSRINVDIDLKGRQLKRNLEYANKYGIPIVIIVGKKEIEQNSVIVRDMKKREQEEVKISNLATYITTKIKQRGFENERE